MPNIFQGNKIRLCAVEASDWVIHHQWDLDTDNGRLTPPMKSGFRIRPLLRRHGPNAKPNSSPEDDVFRFQIVTVADGQLVGTINTHACNPRCGTFMYGLAIHPDHRRKGYASEAIGLVLRYYFDERRYQKVNAEVYSFNAASIALHERLGFTLEGRLRRMIYSGGGYHDALNYGLTNEEFAAAAWHPG